MTLLGLASHVATSRTLMSCGPIVPSRLPAPSVRGVAGRMMPSRCEPWHLHVRFQSVVNMSEDTGNRGELLAGLPVVDRTDGGTVADFLRVPYAVQARRGWLHFAWNDLRRYSGKARWRVALVPAGLEARKDRARMRAVGWSYLRTAPTQLLDRFIKIAVSSDVANAVVCFAREHGVLDLCEHGLPLTHRIDHGFTRLFGVDPGMCRPVGFDLSRRRPHDSGREPIKLWVRYSRAALGAVRFASGKGNSADRKAIEELLPPLGLPDPPKLTWYRRPPLPEPTPADDRNLVAHFVNSWLATGGAGPMLRDREGRLTYVVGGRYGSGRPWAALGVQLA